MRPQLWPRREVWIWCVPGRSKKAARLHPNWGGGVNTAKSKITARTAGIKCSGIAFDFTSSGVF
eukprot:2395680-Rhodomonas_salina.6